MRLCCRLEGFVIQPGGHAVEWVTKLPVDRQRTAKRLECVEGGGPILMSDSAAMARFVFLAGPARTGLVAADLYDRRRSGRSPPRGLPRLSVDRRATISSDKAGACRPTPLRQKVEQQSC